MAITPFDPAEEPFGDLGAVERAEFEALCREELAELNALLPDRPDDHRPFDDEDLAGWDVPLVEALAGLGSQPSDLVVLASLEPSGLSPSELMEQVSALDRVAAMVAWLRARSLVAAAGEHPSGSLMAEMHVEHEISLARTTSRYGAGRALEDARALAVRFPRIAEALRAGETSERHVAVMVEKTRPVRGEEVLAAIEARVLPYARSMPVTRFGKEVAKAIAALDPDAAGRCRRAREERGVSARPLDDGLGLLSVVDDWAAISLISQTLDADAAVLRGQRGGAAAVAAGGEGSQEARLGACRADALAARVLGTLQDDGSVSFERSSVPVSLNLVMDLETLRAERDRLVLLEGQPVPAGLGREWLGAVKTWRRCVTDPVTGALLDYGTSQYLPGPLRRFVLARDGECRSPSCSVHAASRIEMDHAREFPAGASSSANGGVMCTSDHQLKTAGHITITDSAADGSCTWTTAWGQTVKVPARPYLHDPGIDPHDEGSVGAAPPGSAPPGSARPGPVTPGSGSQGPGSQGPGSGPRDPDPQGSGPPDVPPF